MHNDISTSVSASEHGSDKSTPPPAIKAPGRSNVILQGLFVLAIFYTLYFAREILLPIVLALLLTLILAPVVGLLRRLRIPEGLGAAAVVAALVSLLTFGVYSLIEPASDWIAKAPDTMQQFDKKLGGFRKSVRAVSKAADKVAEITSVEAKPAAATQVVAPKPTLLSRILTGTQNLLVAAAATIVLLYFLLASGDMFLRKLVHILPRLKDKKHAVEIARTIQSDMAQYLFTITCINLGLGVATAVSMYLLGMPNPVLWGVMVAIFNYVPYVGASVSLMVLTAVALFTFEEISHIVLVPAVFFSLTVLEGQIISPILTGRSLTLNPVVIFISMLVWGWLWGVVGALMAVPILMTFKIFCDHFASLSAIGEFLSGRHVEPEIEANTEPSR